MNRLGCQKGLSHESSDCLLSRVNQSQSIWRVTISIPLDVLIRPYAKRQIYWTKVSIDTFVLCLSEDFASHETGYSLRICQIRTMAGCASAASRRGSRRRGHSLGAVLNALVNYADWSNVCHDLAGGVPAENRTNRLIYRIQTGLRW